MPPSSISSTALARCSGFTGSSIVAAALRTFARQTGPRPAETLEAAVSLRPQPRHFTDSALWCCPLIVAPM